MKGLKIPTYLPTCWKHTETGKQKYSGHNLSHCHLVHYESHMDWPGFETGPLEVQGRRPNAWNLPRPLALYYAAAAASYLNLTCVWFMILNTSFDPISTSALKGNGWIIQDWARYSQRPETASLRLCATHSRLLPITILFAVNMIMEKKIGGY